MSVRRRGKKGETREETRTRERKTEKKYELGIFGGTPDYNVIIGGLDFNILYVVLRPGILIFKFNYRNSF